jgi:hypothetical protein
MSAGIRLIIVSLMRIKENGAIGLQSAGLRKEADP